MTSASPSSPPPAPTAGGGLLAVHAHPDDETLSTGALLATWASAGRPVTVVTCTRGEQGEVIPPDLAHLEGDGPALAAHRERELAAALRALGVTEHLYLDRLPGTPPRVADSGMAWVGAGRATAADRLPPAAFVGVPVDVVARPLAEVVVARRPDVVVGYEPGGGYGHPDHVHAHRVMQRAVQLAEETAGVRVPVVLWHVLAEAALRSGRAALAGRTRAAGSPAAGIPADGLTVPDASGPVPACTVPADLVDVRVDVERVLEPLRAALSAHATQVQAVRLDAGPGPLRGEWALSNRELQPVLPEETYRYASGRSVGTVDWPAGVTARVP